MIIDGANGVGGFKVKQLQEHIGDRLSITVVNDSSSGKLNSMVDYFSTCFVYLVKNRKYSELKYLCIVNVVHNCISVWSGLRQSGTKGTERYNITAGSQILLIRW